MDIGLAIILIVFTGIIMFCVGLVTPFLVIRVARHFHVEFGEFFDEENDE